jgi:aminopeptidase N
VLVREGTRPHRLRVTAYDDAWAERGSRMVDLGDEPVRCEDWAGLVVVPNAQGETFARLRLDARSWQAVATGMHRLDDDLTRAVLWGAALDRVHTGDLAPTAYLELVAANLPHEPSPTLVRSVLQRTLSGVLPRRVAVADAPAVLDVLAAACAAGLAGAPDEQRAIALTRGLATCGRDEALLRRWLEDGRTEQGVDLDPSLRWQVVHRLAELGALDEAAIAAEEARDTSAEGAHGAATARAARPDPAAKAAAWAAMADDEAVSNRRFSALAEGLWSVERPDLVAPYVDRYLARGPDLAARGQAFSLVVGWAFPSVPLDDARVGALRRTLDGAEVPTVLRRPWEDRYDDLT